ncbi:MAG: ribbon-helix-helix protein, CopG family [bacterium]|nr:ribbon-helix-helix protein, CopG family [bacterium]
MNIQISFALDKDTHAKLQEIARKQNRSMANLIKTMIKNTVTIYDNQEKGDIHYELD